MSGCEPTDDVRRIIRAMARAKVEEGYTDANAIVDEIHDAIQDHTPLWKNEIADIITGIGQPRRGGTKSDLQSRLEQLRKDLKDTYHPKPAPKSPEERRNTQRQNNLKQQIDDIQEQLRTGNFDKPKKSTIPDDKATQKLRLDLAAAKREADKAMAKIERSNRTPLQKTVDTMAEFYRASILSGYTVFEHLTGASIGRFLTAPLEQIAGEVIHHTPGLRGLSERAPTEGGGFQGKALAEGYKSIFTGETGKAMKDKILRGYSDRQALYDKHADYDGAFLSFVGHSHDAIKTAVEQFAFYKSLTTINAQMRRELAKQGMSEHQIDAHLTNEYTQARNATIAYAHSKAAKLQGKNWVVDTVQGAIRAMEKQGALGKVAAGGAKLAMPIIRIPTNFAKETAEYATGIPHAAIEALWDSVTRSSEHISPELADDILRKLKKGLVGLALMPLGWALYQSLGAKYDEKRRKKAGEPEYGDIRTPGGDISHHMLHIPAIEVMQMAALAHRVWNQQYGKADKKTGERTGAVDAAGEAALRAALAEGKTLPFVPDHVGDALSSSKGFGDYTGKLAAGFVPQIVQQVARATDKDQAPRKPKGFVQQIEAGIPGLRENVPHKDLKQLSLDDKLDLYDKMSARERQSSGIEDAIYEQARRMRTPLTDDQQRRIEAIP